jgi:uncharacterized protein
MKNSLIVKNIRQDVERFFLKSKSSHDFEHILRVYNLCEHLGKIEKADMEILRLSALLHDIARSHQDKTKGIICHAKKGAQMAKKILEKYNFDQEKIKQVVHCVETHRYRDNNIPESKEAKILFDADKLDSSGAVGIGRAFLFAGENGAKLHNDKSTDITKTKEYSKEDTAYREFIFKLKDIKDKMFTTEGKRLAKKRYEFMKKFFERLEKEIEGGL